MSKQRRVLCRTVGAVGDDDARSLSDSAESGKGSPPDRRHSLPLPLVTSSSVATRRTGVVVGAETAISGGLSWT